MAPTTRGGSYKALLYIMSEAQLTRHPSPGVSNVWGRSKHRELLLKRGGDSNGTLCPVAVSI